MVSTIIKLWIVKIWETGHRKYWYCIMQYKCPCTQESCRENLMITQKAVEERAMKRQLGKVCTLRGMKRERFFYIPVMWK